MLSDIHEYFNITKISKNELQNLTDWIQKKDYSTLDLLTVGDYLAELEDRLKLIKEALLCGGNCRNNLKWTKLNHHHVALKKNNINDFTPIKTTGISVLGQLELQNLVESGKQRQKNKLPFIKPKKDTNIVEYTKQQMAIMGRELYTASYKVEQPQVAVLIDIKNNTNASLLDQFYQLLDKVRQETGILEPDEPYPFKAQRDTLKRFVKHRAIQYLDLQLYCLLKSPNNEFWKLTDQMFDDLLFSGLKGCDLLKKNRKNFYHPHLMNHVYMDEFLTNVRSDSCDIKFLISSL
ncbi:MAG: hypothetical protein ACI8UC_001327 [Psychromonas sp.]|jgi:hypothetical protein